MKSHPMIRSLAMLLTFLLLFSLIPTHVLAEPSQEEIRETIPETEPEETEPEETEPEETEPEETEPEETEPEETEPEETEPEETEPEETEPEETDPEETDPEETEPQSTEPSETVSQETVAAETVPVKIKRKLSRQKKSGPGLYFGILHSHTTVSDGLADLETSFLYASETANLDFFAATDHSDSFDHSLEGSLTADGSSVSQNWADGKETAADLSGENLTCLWGYEMSWPRNMQIGHIGTFNTPGFQSWQQPDYQKYGSALENYYAALSAVPGAIGQFNHPSTDYGTFCDFDFLSADADRVMTLLEIDFHAKEPCLYYIKALDRGWHVAPSAGVDIRNTGWSDGIPERTVVYAESSTEEDLYAALRSRQVYASGDSDLEIRYSLDEHPMGSRLALRQVGETASLSVSLADPTDDAIGLVEVVTRSGTVSASQPLSDASGTLTFTLPTNLSYYFIRVIQPDGDIALTAPVWINPEEHLGIESFVCNTPVPVQNEPISLSMTLFNRESSDLLLKSAELLADGKRISVIDDLKKIPAHSGKTHTIALPFNCVGTTELTLRLSGTLDGLPREYTSSITVQFRLSEQCTDILVDGSHGNAGLDSLQFLAQLAKESDVRLTVAKNESDFDFRKEYRFLLISAPSRPFSDAFLETVTEFARLGGSIVLCGQADRLESGFHSAAQLNRLLSALGSTMEIQDDTAWDSVNSGKRPYQIYSDQINRDSSFCKSVNENQVYRMTPGSTVDPGKGTPLVEGRDTTGSRDLDKDGLGGSPEGAVTLLACETLSGGGTVFAAGSLFLADEALEEPGNIWDEPYANRTIAQVLLNIGKIPIPLSSIQDARSAKSGIPVRIRGYVTAGTANPHTTFPDTLYLQDDTGGMAVIPFRKADISIGTAMEFIGCVEDRHGNKVLNPTSSRVLDVSAYRYLPLTGKWNTLLDTAENEGRLIQVEGKCLKTTLRKDGTLETFLLEDSKGNRAKVKIDDGIFNGSDGKNTLHKSVKPGRTIRAMGILHIDADGTTIIRVRNCEEVVYIPPRKEAKPASKPDPSNPKTGDFPLAVIQ